MFRIIRFLLTFAFLAAIALLLAGAFLTDNQPALSDASPPTPEEVVEAKQFVRGVRAAINPGQSASSSFQTTEAELNGVIKLGARIVPGFRGKLDLLATGAYGRMSMPVPLTSGRRWLNVSAMIPQFEGDMQLSNVTVGGVQVPPGIALWAIRVAGNIIGGNGLGDTVVGAATGMDIEGDTATFALEMSEMGSNGIMRGMFQSLRGSELPDAEDIDAYYVLIRDAMEQGVLPTEGSYLPHLRFTLQAALDGSEANGPENAYTSALFGLALACGARDFPLIVGGLIVDDLGAGHEWTTTCDDLTLNDRIDSRRHFTTAAAIQAASNRGFAVSVGEFKELYDSVGSGFDFTDIAANNSGIRLSNLFMTADPASWPALIDRMTHENAVILPFDDIPQIMKREDFEATFQDVDSEAYRAMIADIETRIDALALHSAATN